MFFQRRHWIKWITNSSLLVQEIKEDDSDIKHTSQVILTISYVYKAPYKTNHEK